MNRSEKLCELFGIELECMLNKNCEYENPCNVCMYGIYPDFTKPTNFIKLLEMKIFKTQTLLKNIMGWSFSLTRDIDDINSFVEAIENYIYELKEQDYYEIIEEIQQQAQATKWDY